MWSGGNACTIKKRASRRPKFFDRRRLPTEELQDVSVLEYALYLYISGYPRCWVLVAINAASTAVITIVLGASGIVRSERRGMSDKH